MLQGDVIVRSARRTGGMDIIGRVNHNIKYKVILIIVNRQKYPSGRVSGREHMFSSFPPYHVGAAIT